MSDSENPPGEDHDDDTDTGDPLAGDGPALDADQTQEKTMPPTTGRTYLSVPFAEKD